MGYGLKNDLAGDDIPAYRVVNSKGEHGKNWCVDMKKYGWRVSLDEVEKIREEIKRRENDENIDF